MYTTWREYKNHSGSTKTEGWSELSFHPWEDAGNSSTIGEENSKISSLHYWRKVLVDCLLVYCAMKIHLLTDLTWGLQGTDLTKHFGELLKWLLALRPLAWRLSHPVCSITHALHGSTKSLSNTASGLCTHCPDVSDGWIEISVHRGIWVGFLIIYIIIHLIAVLLFKKNPSWVSYQSTIKTSGEVSKCFGQQCELVSRVHSWGSFVFLCFIFCQIPISAKLCSSLPFQLQFQEQLQLVPRCLRVEFTYTRCQEHFELARWT